MITNLEHQSSTQSRIFCKSSPVLLRTRMSSEYISKVILSPQIVMPFREEFISSDKSFMNGKKMRNGLLPCFTPELIVNQSV